MLEFIDVKKYKQNNPNEVPTTGHFSFSDKLHPNRLFVSSLQHGDSIVLDKLNAQKMIDFLQKNVIDVEGESDIDDTQDTENNGDYCDGCRHLGETTCIGTAEGCWQSR